MTMNGIRQPKTQADVIIVGAGPVGLLTALRLGQAGIDTLVVEKHETLLKSTRAVVYMPVVIPVLQELGIFDAVQQHAHMNRQGVMWRDVEGKPLAQLPLASSDPGEFGGVLQLGQWKLGEMILKALCRYPSVEVRFGLNITDIHDETSSQTVQITAQTRKEPDCLIHLKSKYVLGTDGANSTVRKLLGIGFDGFTYEQFSMIGSDVLYDFAKHEGYSSLNFTVHSEMWAVIAYTAEDEDGNPHDMNAETGTPLWRVAYVEDPTLPNSKEAIRQRAEERMKVYCRKAPETYRIIRAEPYHMHQRHASQARKGRVMLAGDALHSNNPIGGLGLTGGILDAFCYGNAFIRVLSKSGQMNDDLLTECANARLTAWKTTTDKLSQANMARLYATDPDNEQAREQFFKKLNGEDEEAKKKFAGMVRSGFDRMMVSDFSEGVDDIIKREGKVC